MWASYGQLLRGYNKTGESVIIKHVELPPVPSSERAKVDYLRKKKSYQIELDWYRSNYSINGLRLTPLVDFYSDGSIYAIEDLSRHLYTPISSIQPELLKIILTALAAFHAYFLNVNNSYWDQGGYWSLDKRQFEWQSMSDEELKNQAHSIDQELNSAKHQTIIHGDFKLANILHKSYKEVAFVDFQYPGAGVGVKDLITLFASLPEEEHINWQEELITFYFQELSKYENYTPELEKEWRDLYPLAWADYIRFLNGWK